MKPNTFLFELRSSIVATIVFVIILCGIYPLFVWGIAQLVFPHQANGSLIHNDKGEIIGSELLAQAFDDSIYFHPRPSAAGNGFDAANSSGSNLGPTSQKLNDAIKERVETYRKENGLKESEPVPADAVTASGSGLDPHISVPNAELQAPRIAKARHLTVEKVLELVRANTDGPDLGLLGEPHVNVLQLNLTLDKL
jgi:K+-transporting ATPase ATPase C chain